MDSVLLANRAADSAAIASGLVDDNFIVGRTVGYGAELAETHALPAAVAKVGVNGSNILGPEHNGNLVCYGASHREAVGAIAVAYSGDEWCAEGPYGVAEALLFVASEISDCLFLCERFKGGGVRPAEKAVVDASNDSAEFSTIGAETEAVTVTLFPAESDVAAKAGDTDNGVYKAEDALDILDGHDLAEMVLFHPSSDNPPGDGPYDGRRLCKLVQTLYMSFDFFGFCEKGLDILSPANITQQVVRVVIRLQIPLLALAMLQAELTHTTSFQNLPMSSQVYIIIKVQNNKRSKKSQVKKQSYNAKIKNCRSLTPQIPYGVFSRRINPLQADKK
jgi:hypothetical protein